MLGGFKIAPQFLAAVERGAVWVTMKTWVSALLLVALFASAAHASVYTIQIGAINSVSFTPSALTIAPGDTVNFQFLRVGDSGAFYAWRVAVVLFFRPVTRSARHVLAASVRFGTSVGLHCVCALRAHAWPPNQTVGALRKLYAPCWSRLH